MLTNPLIEEIIELVNNEILFALFAKAVRGYNREENIIPVNTIIASFVPYENKSRYFEDENANTCLKTDLTLKMTVYAHSSRKGKQLNAIAELICEFLSEHYIGSLSDYKIGDLKYNDTANSITLPCYLHFIYNSCPLEGTDSEIPDAIPDSFFCKAHVNNTDVHITADDRAFLNMPVAVGTYDGVGGETAQEIILGFSPSAVIIFRNGRHPASYSSTDGISNCYIGFAAGGACTRGIAITQNGFTARTVETTNATTHLNDEGSTYSYIAFR